MEFDFVQNGEVPGADFQTRVPENFRGAYVQEGDTYKINPALKGVVDAVVGFSTALKSERSAHNNLKKLKDTSAAVQEAFSEFGVTDLETAKAKFAEMADTIKTNSKVDPKKIRDEVEATFRTERDALKADNAKMFGTLKTHLVDNQALAALNEHKGNAKLLMPVIAGLVDVVKDGDGYVVRVKDGDGQYRGNGMGGFMTVSDLVKDLKSQKDYGIAFESDKLPGPGGGNPGPGRQQQQQFRERQAQGDMSPADKIAAGLAARRRTR